MRVLSLYSQIPASWELATVAPWLFAFNSYLWLLLTAALRMLAECDKSTSELIEEEMKRQEEDSEAGFM